MPIFVFATILTGLQLPSLSLLLFDMLNAVEVHLRWVYSTSRSGEESGAYRAALEAMLHNMESTLPTEEQSTPQAIYGRLLQYANVMERELGDLNAVLSQ